MEDYTYYQLENPEDIDKFEVEGFDFFKGLGIIDYKRTFKAWLRKFPKPLFIVAVRNDRLISWVHVDEWREGVARDGNSINILRAIETLPDYRSRKIGFRLVLLSLQRTIGYMITKPVSAKARTFFEEIGFKDEKSCSRCPVDLTRHSGYLVMNLKEKSQFLTDFSWKFLGNNSNNHRNNSSGVKNRKNG
jgi:GNAT superfamily N-acetyltransferase